MTSIFTELNISSATSNYTVLTSDNVIAVGTLTSAITITLPASPSIGDSYIIKDTDGYAGQYHITISPPSGYIDGLADFVLNNPYQSVNCVYVGSQWSVIVSYPGKFAKCLVQSASNQNPTSPTKVNDWTIIFDTLSSFSVSNSYFVVPADGYYSCSGQLQSGTAVNHGIQLEISVYVNGSAYQSEFTETQAGFDGQNYISVPFNFLVFATYGSTLALYYQASQLNALPATMFWQIQQLP